MVFGKRKGKKSYSSKTLSRFGKLGGRPQKYSSSAEKQKAYRLRKKQAEQGTKATLNPRKIYGEPEIWRSSVCSNCGKRENYGNVYDWNHYAWTKNDTWSCSYCYRPNTVYKIEENRATPRAGTATERWKKFKEKQDNQGSSESKLAVKKQTLNKNTIMLGIIQVAKEIGKKSKLSQEQIKQVLNDFLEVAKQQLVKGESISFKGYFSLKRLSTPPKGNKNCDDHQREIERFKLANKGKGVQFYAKSVPFRSLVTKTRNCNKCQAKKQALVKGAKPVNRLSLRPSKEFWVSKKR